MHHIHYIIACKYGRIRLPMEISLSNQHNSDHLFGDIGVDSCSHNDIYDNVFNIFLPYLCSIFIIEQTLPVCRHTGKVFLHFHMFTVLEFAFHFRTFFNIADIKGRKINVFILRNISADHFVVNIANLHQKLAEIVRQFNFCFSVQVISHLFLLFSFCKNYKFQLQYMQISVIMFLLSSSTLYGFYLVVFSRRTTDLSLTACVHNMIGCLVFGTFYISTCFLGTKINSEVERFSIKNPCFTKYLKKKSYIL